MLKTFSQKLLKTGGAIINLRNNITLIFYFYFKEYNIRDQFDDAVEHIRKCGGEIMSYRIETGKCTMVVHCTKNSAIRVKRYIATLNGNEILL